MKKNILIVFMAFSMLDLFSQIEKEKVIISIDGNYMKTNTESGVTSNQNVTQGKYLTVGPSIGCFLTDRFIVGIGFDYNWSKEARTNISYSGTTLSEEVMDIKSHIFSPSLYFGYYYPIFSKFYISTRLKFNFGSIKSEYSTLKVSSSPLVTPVLTDPTMYDSISSLTSYNQSSSFDYFSANISPELTYFITEKFGLNLGIGGIAYAMIDWKKDNSSWVINFNPTYWRLGIKIKI